MNHYVKFQKVIIIFLFNTFLFGCSSQKTLTKTQKTTKAQTEKRSFATGGIEIVKRDNNRKILWKINADHSTFTYEGGRKLYTSLYKVKGKLYKDNHATCKFTAATVILDQFNNIVEISGNIIAHNIDNSITLKANKMKWLIDKYILEAKGDVTVDSKDFVFGPCSEVIASTNLKDIGTPDLIKSKQ